MSLEMKIVLFIYVPAPKFIRARYILFNRMIHYVVASPFNNDFRKY